MKGVSLIIVILVIASILTGTIIVGDILIRHSMIVKGTEISERAYFAAESAVEKAAYGVLKNHEDITSYAPAGSLDNGADYGVTTPFTPDTACPNAPTECASGNITSANPWNVGLSSGQSFWLDIDLNGASYPTSLNISATSPTSSELIVWECTTVVGPPRDCDPNQAPLQTVYYGWSPSVDISLSTSTKYYRIRIINNTGGGQTYAITPNANLPIGVIIESWGKYSNYKRYLNSNFPKWQKFAE